MGKPISSVALEYPPLFDIPLTYDVLTSLHTNHYTANSWYEFDVNPEYKKAAVIL